MKIANVIKEEQKKIRTAYLDSINKQLHSARNANNGRIPYRLVETIIQNSTATIPWLTRSIVQVMMLWVEMVLSSWMVCYLMLILFGMVLVSVFQFSLDDDNINESSFCHHEQNLLELCHFGRAFNYT